MIRKKAQHILDNFNFDEAIDFIRAYGDEGVATKVLSLSRSSFTERKLTRELERISSEYPEENIEAEIKIDATNLNDQDLINKRNELVKRRDHLQGQLELIPNDEERLKTALEILRLSEELRNVWQDINQARSGVKPVEEKDDIESIFEGANILEIEKIRKNYVSYRSKARKGTRNADKLPFYEQVIAEAEKRLSHAV